MPNIPFLESTSAGSGVNVNTNCFEKSGFQFEGNRYVITLLTLDLMPAVWFSGWNAVVGAGFPEGHECIDGHKCVCFVSERSSPISTSSSLTNFN